MKCEQHKEELKNGAQHASKPGFVRQSIRHNLANVQVNAGTNLSIPISNGSGAVSFANIVPMSGFLLRSQKNF